MNEKLGSKKDITVNDQRRAASIISGLREALKSVFNFYNAYDPLFTWWVPEPYKALDTILSVYNRQFKTVAEKNSPNKDSSGIVGFPIGRDEIVRQLKYEMIPYSPEELIKLQIKSLNGVIKKC